jgi:hypothetical protein
MQFPAIRSRLDTSIQSHIFPAIAMPGTFIRKNKEDLNPDQETFYIHKIEDFVLRKFKNESIQADLTFGERVVLWMYKICQSTDKNWFTFVHLSLLIGIGLYLVGGAFLFMLIEGEQLGLITKSASPSVLGCLSVFSQRVGLVLISAWIKHDRP